MQWFEVDKLGLAKLLERKGKEFALYELIQNAWDEDTEHVSVDLRRVYSGSTYVELTVTDDNPKGFENLSHAFTLFAESYKKGSPEKRGRFNLGEKLVLALCRTAVIRSTTGAVVFDQNGRRTTPALRTERGSVFIGELRMTNDEMAECAAAVRRLLPPSGIETRFNGQVVPVRAPLSTIGRVELATELSDDEGRLRRYDRKTTLGIYECLPGETAMIYEMGIPVVETGDRWHVNVGQKVPLNFNRDNVQPAYLGRVRAAVADHMANYLDSEEASSPWVRDAVQRNPDLLKPETVQHIAELRFGAKRVSYDPSDVEANSRAVAAGYTVVTGSQMTKAEWGAMRQAGAILPAGQVTPSPKPFSPDGKPLKTVAPQDWTPEVAAFVRYAERIGRELLDATVHVTIANDVGWPFAGAYGQGQLTINLGRLGYKWFSGPLVDINDLLIHEFGHHYEKNHLSEGYYDALTRLGAKLAQLALDRPDLFKLR